MAGLSGLKQAGEANSIEDNFKNQLCNIKMIQRVIQLVETVYPNSIHSIYLCSNEDILTNDLSKMSATLVVYIVRSDTANEVFDLLCDYIEDEISYSKNLEASVCYFSLDDSEVIFPSHKYILPIYSTYKLMFNVSGLYQGIHIGKLACIDSKKIYVNRGLFHSSKGVIIVSALDGDTISKLKELSKDGSYSLIILTHPDKYAETFGFVKFLEENYDEM